MEPFTNLTDSLLSRIESQISLWSDYRRKAEHEGDDITVVIAASRLATYEEIRSWIANSL